MSRSLFVVEDQYGAVKFTCRKRWEAEQHNTRIRPVTDVVEYVPLVRCAECRHGGRTIDRGKQIECDNSSGACRGTWNKPDWYCADAEAKETT